MAGRGEACITEYRQQWGNYWIRLDRKIAAVTGHKADYHLDIDACRAAAAKLGIVLEWTRVWAGEDLVQQYRAIDSNHEIGPYAADTDQKAMVLALCGMLAQRCFGRRSELLRRMSREALLAARGVDIN